jgi:hypothetical protein
MRRLSGTLLGFAVLAGSAYAGEGQAAREDQTAKPMDRLENAFALIQNGENREALAELTWCYDHGAEADPSFVGIRNTYVVDTMALLGRQYPPAIEALRARRDAAMVQVGDPPQISLRFFDAVALTRALGEPDQADELIRRCGDKGGIKQFAKSALTSKKITTATELSTKDIQAARAIKIRAELKRIVVEVKQASEKIATFDAKARRLAEEKRTVTQKISELLARPIDEKAMAQLSWYAARSEKVRAELYAAKRQIHAWTEKRAALKLEEKRLREELAKIES